MNVWNELKKLEGQELATLDRGRRFKVENVISPKLVVLFLFIPQNSRLIQAPEIEGAFKELEREKTITRGIIQEKFAPRNSAYVAALLAELPNVEYSLNPIALHLTK